MPVEVAADEQEIPAGATSRRIASATLISATLMSMWEAFDPRRTAVLLIGGDKSPEDPGSPNWNRWYDHYVPVADDLYDNHLRELQEEGLI